MNNVAKASSLPSRARRTRSASDLRWAEMFRSFVTRWLLQFGFLRRMHTVKSLGRPVNKVLPVADLNTCCKTPKGETKRWGTNPRQIANSVQLSHCDRSNFDVLIERATPTESLRTIYSAGGIVQTIRTAYAHRSKYVPSDTHPPRQVP